METVYSLLTDPLQRHAAAEALVAPGRASLTYAEFGRQLEHTHAFLRRAGFGPRSRIGVALPEGPETLVVILAAAASAVCAPLDPDLATGALEGLMAAMRIDCLVVPEGSTSNAACAARALGVPLLLLSPALNGPAGAHELATDCRGEPASPQRPGPEDLAFLWHTSGTTGTPKVVPYEQWRICADVRKRIARRALGRTDRCLITMVMSSSVLVRTGLLPNLAVGAAVVHAGDLRAESLVAALEDLAPTYFFAAPALHTRLLEILEQRGTGIRHNLRVIYSSFAEQSPDVRSRLERLLGVPMVVAYGMTEVGAISETSLPPDDAPMQSVGRPTAEVAIADDAGNFLSRGQEGEVWVRGPEVIGAYESPPEANRDSFRDSWFRTGDCGRIDERGFLHLTGRIKDVINRGGVKVSPSEVELVLASHPAVREAAVFARRHPTLGEDVSAAVVFETGRRASEAELRRFARHRLSATKVPTRIVAADSIPRNAAGKLQRAELAVFGEAMLRQAWEAPRGLHEEQVARIFRLVLRTEDIGRGDQFFDRGGDSLRAIEVLERIRECLGAAVSMDTLLDNPSVAGLARAVAEILDQTNSPLTQ